MGIQRCQSSWPKRQSIFRNDGFRTDFNSVCSGHSLRRPEKQAPTRSAKTSGSHFRLSAISSKAKENLNFWSTYLTTQRIGSNPPYVVIASNGKGWIDLIIGEPLENDFYCLRANENALPVTSTEIEAKQLRKLESEAKEYLQTYQFGSPGLSTQRRAWWSGLFSKERGS